MRAKAALVIDIRAPIVDEFGELERKVAEFKPTRDRHEALKKQIAGWFEATPADQPDQVEGQVYVVQASPRANQRLITSIPKLFRRLGQKLFLEVASIPLKAIDAHIPASEHESFIVEKRSGSRSIKAVLKNPAVPKAA